MFNFIKYCAYFFVLIGALNWGFIGFFNFDLVAFLFGEMTILSRTVYAIVGISSIIFAISMYTCKKNESY